MRFSARSEARFLFFQLFPAVAAHTKAGKIGTLLLNALKTPFSYFDKLGSFCLSSLCRLKPIFPAVAAHTKAGKIGTLLLNTLKTSFSYFDKLGSFCLPRLCRLKPIFPAVAAHTKAGKIGTLLRNALKVSFSFFWQTRIFLFVQPLPPKTDFSSRSCPY